MAPRSSLHSRISLDTEKQLAAFVASFRFDPYGFVMGMFPWGVKDGPLEKRKGPEPWQEQLLKRLGQHLANNHALIDLGLHVNAFRSATVSGHDVGKSAEVAWLILFFMSVYPDCRGLVTANTQDQLETRTWPELSKWHTMILNRHWFNWTATSFYFAAYPDEKRKNYMFSAQTVSLERPEAFQGLHNLESCVVIIVDEASGIDAKVMEVAEGALLDGEPFIFKFGNPTRPDGEFYECADGKWKDMYFVQHIDSREVSWANPNTIRDIIKKYGEDSDEAKVRIYGQFPSQAFDGYMPINLVNEAMQRLAVWDDNSAPLILGVDVARMGDDRSVLFGRRGRDARTWNKPPWMFKGLNSIQLAEKVAEWCIKYRPDGIVIENSGNSGAGVIDQLRNWNYKVTEVHPGAMSKKPQFDRHRGEWWGDARQWLYDGGCLADDSDLFAELTKVRYKVVKMGETKLEIEKKEDLKQRLGFSPDYADAFVLTFAAKFQRKNARLAPGAQSRQQAIIDYDVLAM